MFAQKLSALGLVAVSILGLVLIIVPASGMAQPTDNISFQAFVTDDLGNPINGTESVKLTIFDSKTAGSQVWTRTYEVVNFVEGVANILLDAGTPDLSVVPFDKLLWVEVTVDDEVIDPRVFLTSVPFAHSLRHLRVVPNANADLAPNMIGGHPDNSITASASVIAGGGSTDGGNLINSITSSFSVVGGGTLNAAGGSGSVIGGGHGNTTSGLNTLVAGGIENTAGPGSWSTVAGGWDNEATGQGGFVGGGRSNLASGTNSGVVSGFENEASSSSATVGGGSSNVASATFSFVGGGLNNVASGSAASVGGGSANSAADSATVAGGIRNDASGESAAIGGGRDHAASGETATVGGGVGNTASGESATISGGLANTATAPKSAVGGGQMNHASNSFATVGGGQANIASGFNGTVSGGAANKASGSNATTGGGNSNTAGAPYATVPGGFGNRARGEYAFAAGRKAVARHDHSFVWNGDDSASGDSLHSQDTGEFVAMAPGGVFFFTRNDQLAGVELPSNSGAWAPLSSVHAKTDFEDVSASDVLEKLDEVDILKWRYKGEDRTIRHVGPMAQDFYAAFGLGKDEEHIATVDADGIALAAIKALREQNLQLLDEIAILKQRLSDAGIPE